MEGDCEKGNGRRDGEQFFLPALTRAQVNLREAFEQYKKSADQGNANGLYNIGRMYDNGIGVPEVTLFLFHGFKFNVYGQKKDPTFSLHKKKSIIFANGDTEQSEGSRML